VTNPAGDRESRTATVEVVGRASELSSLADFLVSDRWPRAFVLAGGPGVGKTTLWDAAVAHGRERAVRVIAARASGAETRLSFAALIDLLDGVEDEAFAGLPPPQRTALEVALYRTEPTSTPPEPHAIALGVLNVLRALAARRTVLVALDDVQWLDRASEDALTFAARRLSDERVAFLLARRPGPPSDLERALDRTPLERLEVRAPSLDAVRRILSQRLGLTLPRHVLRRVYEATLGNPLFALELGRMLMEVGLPATGEDLPVPDAVENLLGTRVAGLPEPARRVLLAVALDPTLRTGQLVSLGEPDAVDAAVEAGVVVVDGDDVRAGHPLLAAAAVREASRAERRELHLALAGVVAAGELRTRHLALAAPRPDAELATTVAAAAANASQRGAPRAAVELAEHALRLTPHDDASRDARVLELAGYLVVAGEKRRVTALLKPRLPSLPTAAMRARALVLLANGEIRGNDDIQRYLEQALVESGDDLQARASVLADMAENVAAVRVERIAEAEAWALEAVPATAAAEPELERRALYALAWARSLGGRPIDDVWERFRSASPGSFHIGHSPERVAGQRLVWRGEIAAARAVLTRQLAEADERGELSSYALQRLHVCELELRAGGWDAAETLLDEWAESADRELLHWPMYERCRALLAAGRGLPDEARRWGKEAETRASAAGVRWDQLEAQRALATAELLLHETDRAAERLREVWEHTESEGVRDPGAFPVAPELVEALLERGEVEAARLVTARVEERAEQQDHPWGRVTARRCASHAALALVYDEAAVTGLERAAEEYARLGLCFDAARSLLALGREQRRSRKWGAARATLERAAAAFDALGSPGWAEEARSELERVGARRPSPAGELTPTERRVAELAVQGLANKEIAQALVVSVSTVEFHLSNTYSKLGVRSRTQLAGRLAAPTEPPH
jgi:DNA-binding CsgD family transcriptional regulator